MGTQWHLQPTRLTARHFENQDSGDADASFTARAEPDILAQVDLRADGDGYVHAAMSRCNGTASPSVWRDLARELRRWGVRTISWAHKGKDSSREAERAWADTVPVEP